MYGTWLNPLPTTFVNSGPLISRCNDCGTLLINTTLIPSPKPLCIPTPEPFKIELPKLPPVRLPEFKVPETTIPIIKPIQQDPIKPYRVYNPLDDYNTVDSILSSRKKYSWER